MTNRKPKTRRSKPESGRALVLAPFLTMGEHDPDRMVAFIEHCGIDLGGMTAVEQLPDIIAAHYWLGPGVYDIDAVATHLATFPPVAARIREIRIEQARTGKAAGCR